MKSVKVCEYSRSSSFHDGLILQDQASGERSQDQWSSGQVYTKEGLELTELSIISEQFQMLRVVTLCVR